MQLLALALTFALAASGCVETVETERHKCIELKLFCEHAHQVTCSGDVCGCASGQTLTTTEHADNVTWSSYDTPSGRLFQCYQTCGIAQSTCDRRYKAELEQQCNSATSSGLGDCAQEVEARLSLTKLTLDEFDSIQMHGCTCLDSGSRCQWKCQRRCHVNFKRTCCSGRCTQEQDGDPDCRFETKIPANSSSSNLRLFQSLSTRNSDLPPRSSSFLNVAIWYQHQSAIFGGLRIGLGVIALLLVFLGINTLRRRYQSQKKDKSPIKHDPEDPESLFSYGSCALPANP